MKSLSEYINTKKPKAYLLVGLPGSGKSTWCRKNYPNLPIVSRDIIRAELGFTKDADEKAALEWWKEEKVTKRENELIEKLCSERKDFIIDDTNLKKKFRKKMIDFLHNNGAIVIGVRFSTDIDTCIDRRKDQISEETMRQIFSKMDQLEDDEVDKTIEAN